MDISIINQNFADSNISGLENNAKLTEDKELKKACQGFEGIFLKYMLKSMRSSLPGEPLFESDNHGMDIYKSMHDEYLAEELSRRGQGTGLGEYLYNELREKS